MQGYWIKSIGGFKGYCEGETIGQAAGTAERLTGRLVDEIDRLPYPASPVIWQQDHPVYGKCPPFCYDPDKCKGKTSCPKMGACSE